MVEQICLILMVVLAIFSIMSVSLRNAVILMAIYSLLCSYVYLLYHAPDVAIAEAVIGAAFITIIFWVAIKRHKAIRIYYLPCIVPESVMNKNPNISCDYSEVMKIMEQFLQDKELEPTIIRSKETVEDIQKADNYDYIFQWDDTSVTVYGRENDHHFDELEIILTARSDLNAKIYRLKERDNS